MKTLRNLLLPVACGAALWCSQAQMTFQFTFDGSVLVPPNGATAVGTITFAPGYPLNPGNSDDDNLPFTKILDLSVTVSGSTGGDGTFGMDAFADYYFSIFGTTPLDLNSELVGQSNEAGTWGADTGDFNLFGAAPPAPTGVAEFALVADGGNAELMLLTSFRPIPETHECALMAGIGLLGFAVWRRRPA